MTELGVGDGQSHGREIDPGSVIATCRKLSFSTYPEMISLFIAQFPGKGGEWAPYLDTYLKRP